MKIQKTVKFLNLIKIDINWIGVFLRACRCLLELIKFSKEYHPKGYLLHQLYFVFVSPVYLVLVSF